MFANEIPRVAAGEGKEERHAGQDEIKGGEGGEASMVSKVRLLENGNFLCRRGLRREGDQRI